MKVPFIDYTRFYFAHKREMDQAIQGCLERGDLIYRGNLIKFEKDFAEFCGCKYGIGTGSCTGAMFIALKALGIGPGDEVITVSHTFIATIDVIVACGATPVLVDVKDDFTMDMDKVLGAINTRIKAIIPVHLNGRICDMTKLYDGLDRLYDQWSDFPQIYIIEDAAQASGAVYKGKKAGSWGKIGCFSFYPSKVLGAYGEGGMAVTNNEKLATLMYSLRDHGKWPYYLSKDPIGIERVIYGWGYSTILVDLQAAVLNVKMKYLDEAIERRRKIGRRYDEKLPNDVILPVSDVYQNYVIRTEKRDELAKHLADNGIETMVKDRIPNHKQKGLGLDHFHLPVTEQISNEVLSLPMYPELTDEEVGYVIEKVREFFNRKQKHHHEPYHTGPGEIICRICGEPCSAKESS